MTDKPLWDQLADIGASDPQAWDEFCAEQHAINAEDHRRADMVTIDRFEHWWDDGNHDDGPTPLGPLSKETARWIWRAALAAQPAVLLESTRAWSRAIAQEERACRAEDALVDLVNQIRKTSPIDDHGHDLTMNMAYLKAVELLDDPPQPRKDDYERP